jgi:hypothetical protein
MLQVLRHSNLPHEFVLVSVHARESANVRKDVLKGVRKLERVKTVLDMCINDKLRQVKNFSTQVVKGISKTGFLPLLRSQRPINQSSSIQGKIEE